MRLVIQRVKKVNVTVEKQVAAEIDEGLLLLVGIGKDDGNDDIEHMPERYLTCAFSTISRGR